MRWIVGGKAIERHAASTNQMGRFETELLATEENLAALTVLPGAWIDKVHDRRPPKMIILDIDSSVKTAKTKGCASRVTAFTMVFKLCQSAIKKWRRLNGSCQIADIIQGVKFKAKKG